MRRRGGCGPSLVVMKALKLFLFTSLHIEKRLRLCPSPVCGHALKAARPARASCLARACLLQHSRLLSIIFVLATACLWLCLRRSSSARQHTKRTTCSALPNRVCMAWRVKRIVSFAHKIADCGSTGAASGSASWRSKHRQKLSLAKKRLLGRRAPAEARPVGEEPGYGVVGGRPGNV